MPEWAFRKWQEEYTVCVDTHVSGENGLVIDTRNISALATIVHQWAVAHADTFVAVIQTRFQLK